MFIDHRPEVSSQSVHFLILMGISRYCAMSLDVIASYCEVAWHHKIDHRLYSPQIPVYRTYFLPGCKIPTDTHTDRTNSIASTADAK